MRRGCNNPFWLHRCASAKTSNIELISEISKAVKIPVIAEGGFSRPEHVLQAFNAGAWSVCIGTAITNPYLLAKSFVQVIS